MDVISSASATCLRLLSRHDVISVTVTHSFHAIIIALTFLSPVLSEVSVVEIRGAGASFPASVYSKWMPNYERSRSIPLHMTYDVIGSGGGKSRIMGGGDPVEYAGSDTSLSQGNYEDFPDLQMFPTMAGAIVIAYHLPGSPPLNLKRDHILGIYNGTIKWWNDTSLTELNPNIVLPNERILVLARSDKSGTTAVFTEALSSFSEEWKKKRGSFSVGLVDYVPVYWDPDVISFFGQSNAGMAGLLLSLRYSLGYLSVAEANKFQLQKARIYNKDGYLVEANVRTTQSSMEAFAGSFSSRMILSIVDAPGNLSYPLSSYTYMIIHKSTMQDCRSATALYRYIQWFLTSDTAKQLTITTNMVPLSDSVVKRINEDVLHKMSCKGQQVQTLVDEERYEEYIASQTWRTPVYTSVPIVIFLLLVFLAFIVFQQIKVNKAIILKHYIIPNDEIKVLTNAIGKSFASMGSAATGKSQTKTANSSRSVRDTTSISGNQGTQYNTSGKFGRWHQETIMMRRTSVIKDSKELKHETKRLLLSMRDSIRHLNIVSFHGITMLDDSVFLVSAYCQKGTLQDVIHAERFNLDDNFKYTLALDIAMGMSHLHQHNIIHGSLSTESCYIDSRWTIKIGDWQNTKLLLTQNAGRKKSVAVRPSGDGMQDGSDSDANRLFWTAPEIIGSREQAHTKYSDVYSFCMSVIELFTRNHPFDDALMHREPKDIVSDILVSDLRPVLTAEIPEALVPILIQCWSPIPSDRPNFLKLTKLIKGANPNRKSLLDCMMEELENYVNHLEDKVKERTVELDAALKQVESLLHKILPPSVAEALARGESVSPEDFESVTIYFSDIVSFTVIAAESTPLDIVDLLNDLYTTFDAIIDSHDVYKVETIGDAYMCISGLPKRNGIDHAAHIANMSIDIAVACGSFKIRHRPKDSLRIRIGINSGSVVAGVVGNKMPRYCLFGDAVNTASRMESNSRPMKIHVSATTKLLLDAIGGYQIRKRGSTDIKGKGEMTTYWLVGKTGYEKELPHLTTSLETDEMQNTRIENGRQVLPKVTT